MVIRCRLDDTWVDHLSKSQTTPTILHSVQRCPLSYDILDIVPEVGKLGGGMWLWGAN